MKNNQRMKQILIPVAIIALGVVGAAALRAAGPKPEKRVAERVIPAVEVVPAQPTHLIAKVYANGLVVPARRVSVSAELNARIVAVSPNLIPGGRLARGDLLIRLDSRDFALAVEQEEARVRQAEVELELERGRTTVAAQEWKLLGKDPSAGNQTLALRQPQLAAAKQNLESAKSGLERARLNLARTTLRAPFNAVVIDKNFDVGQLVGPASTVATLIGSDEIWVDVSVPLSELSMIDIPGTNADQGSPATVTLRLRQGHDQVREGRVLRLKGELDDLSRTARLLISVPHPFSSAGGELPLLPGAYVEVTIAGRAMDSAFRIPRAALDEDRRVWVVNAEDRLEPRPVEIAWREAEDVIVTSGLDQGERVVVSPLKLRAQGERVAPVAQTPQAYDSAPESAQPKTTPPGDAQANADTAAATTDTDRD